MRTSAPLERPMSQRYIPLVLLLAAISPGARGQDSEPASRPASAPAAESAPAKTPGGAAEAAGGAALESRPACEVVVGERTPFDVTGMLSFSYRGRTTEGASDNDIYGYLSLDAGDPEKNNALFHLMGRVTQDLDGDTDQDDNPFYSLNDVSGHSFDSHLYEAWVDFRREWAPKSLALDRIRVGRQNLYAGFTYLVDGVRFDFERFENCGDLRFTLFGGIPEYLYEDSRSGDWIAGFEATFKPWVDGRMDIRYAHVQDRNEWVDQEVNDYLAVTVRHRFSDDLDVWANWDTIDAGTRDASLRVNWAIPRCDLDVHATYRYQATITDEYTTVYDPYVGVLGTSYAYHQIDAEISKLLCCERLGIDAGVSARILQDADNESAFNHEFLRGWLTVTGYEWPRKGFDVSLTGEIWEAEGDEVFSIGGDVTWRPNDELKLVAGSYYSLYKQDLFVVEERQDVTTIFLKAVWRPKDCWRFDGRIEFETGDEGDFLTGIVGVTWTF